MTGSPDADAPRGDTRQMRSEYQLDCDQYYGLLREVHSGVYSASDRKAEELAASRYTRVNHPCVRNLNSFITLLHALCDDGPSVHGVDFGCGSHWFVDHVRETYGWTAVGYDPDAAAIEIAQRRFPASSGFYHCRDPLRNGLPEADASCDFVFCNAVLQHFSRAEAQRAIAEMSRVLKPGGILLLIFKTWDDAEITARAESDEAFQVLDRGEGKVQFRDPTMRAAIEKLPPADQNRLDTQRRDGWRLLHLFPIDWIADVAAAADLTVVPEISTDGNDGVPGVLTYHSGKGVPTASMFFRRADNHGQATSSVRKL